MRACMQTCRHAELQACRHAEMQRCRHADMKICRHMQKCRTAGMQICKNSELLWHARPLQTLKSVILACLATPNAAHDYGDTVVQVAEIMIPVRLAAEINDPGMVHQSMRGNVILAWLATSGAEIKDPGMVGHFKCGETWPWHGWPHQIKSRVSESHFAISQYAQTQSG